MKVGYARVSTKEQNEARQVKAFEELGIEAVYIDKNTNIKDFKRDLMLGDVFYR